MSAFNRDLLLSILSQPAAPYRERHVYELISPALVKAKVPHFFDPAGNLVIGATNERAYKTKLARKSSEPLRIFVAHADHPGFHVTRLHGKRELDVRWFGGAPTEGLVGARVWLADRTGWRGHATIQSASKAKPGGDSSIGECRLSLDQDWLDKPKDVAQLYGGFAFRAPVWQEGDLLYTKAADDLVGAFAITQLAIEQAAKLRSGVATWVALITRAEEVGFVGTLAHLELGWLGKAKRKLLGVSLETSRTLPGAEIGAGPVVRLGDKSTVFDAGALRVFSDLALKLLPGKHQRRVMDGGTCEGTALTAWGIPCVAISVPLGNYHNQNFQGGPDSSVPMGPAPEFVHVGDIEGMLTLCRALVKPKLPWNTPWANKKSQLQKLLRAARPLLKVRD